MSYGSNQGGGAGRVGPVRPSLETLVRSHPAPPITTHGEPSSNTPPTSRRRLNPAFVCQLMGLSWWWTRAEPINFAAAEMESYRSRQRWHFENLCNALD